MAKIVPLLELAPRESIREQILAAFRDSLRDLVDPETGQQISEEEIRRATMRGSRYWTEAEQDDVVVVGLLQRRAEFLAEQIDPRRAANSYLDSFHGAAANLPRLEAEGGSGEVTGTATPGAPFIGSSNLGDQLATRGTDPSGLIYQVLFSYTTPPSGQYRVIVKGVDGGRDTNLAPGTKITWANPPPGAGAPGEVVAQFAGGVSRETAQEYGERLFDARGRRPKAGNAGHFRLWARGASAAIDRAYVYASGLGSGTVVVAITQKRAGLVGPLARIPSVGTMTVAKGVLTPPGSKTVPGQARVVVVPVRPQSSNGVVLVGLRRGTPSGWSDVDPWPRYVSEPARVLSTPAPAQTSFTMRADTALPLVGTPQLMIWDPSRSEFERLAVATISQVGNDFAVTLSQAPRRTITADDRISPLTARLTSVSRGIGAYFDSLGPGELVGPDDARLAIARRQPESDDVEPYEVGGRLVDYISQAIGGSIERGTVSGFAPAIPSIPTFSASRGPFMLVPGHVAMYPA